MKKALIILLILMLWTMSVLAQSEQGTWKRSGETVKLDLQLFRSGQTLSHPTTETLQKYDLEFEISHRFFPPVHEGYNLYGLAGPVNMRIGLSYAITNKLLLTAAVSNVNDNNDFRLKYKSLQLRSKEFPTVIGVQGGLGWNTDVYGRKKGDSKNFQYYGQLIVNTMIRKKLGLGVVPSILYNSNISDNSTSEHSVIMAGYVQYFLNSTLAVLAEWSPVVDGYHRRYNAAALGIELNTGGHFFKILLSNTTWLNPSQFLAGTDYRFKSKEWRLGFNITRLLRLKR